jgi:hypothetical protein
MRVLEIMTHQTEKITGTFKQRNTQRSRQEFSEEKTGLH